MSDATNDESNNDLRGAARVMADVQANSEWDEQRLAILAQQSGFGDVSFVDKSVIDGTKRTSTETDDIVISPVEPKIDSATEAPAGEPQSALEPETSPTTEAERQGPKESAEANESEAEQKLEKKSSVTVKGPFEHLFTEGGDDDGEGEGEEEEEEEYNPFDDFELPNDGLFSSDEVLEDEDMQVNTSDFDRDQRVKELEEEEAERQALVDAYDSGQREENVFVGESSLDRARENLSSHVVDASYMSRNPEPMPEDGTRIDHDRPMSRAVKKGTSKPEPLDLGESKQTSIKIPTVLAETIRAVAVQSLANTVTSLTPTQDREARGHVGSEAYDVMTDQQKRESWIDYFNKKYANNRIVLAFLAAQANIDIEGLDETTSLLVDSMRAVDPVLRELHRNSALQVAVLESHKQTRAVLAEMTQSNIQTEIVLAYLAAWTTVEGSANMEDVRPSNINVDNPNSRMVRDRMQQQAKADIMRRQRSMGRPIR